MALVTPRVIIPTRVPGASGEYACNISTMNEWGPGVNLPYYVKVGLEGTSIVVVVILVI